MLGLNIVRKGIVQGAGLYTRVRPKYIVRKGIVQRAEYYTWVRPEYS